ncbi:UNVERIFIED_ORG: hypothetical protein J2W85_006636 [Ensifer adhaerens]|nr:hypothetical protein [Ensifer adhaerens]
MRHTEREKRDHDHDLLMIAALTVSGLLIVGATLLALAI